MNLEQFTDLLDRHGSRREDWPPTQRAAAERLLADDADAADRLGRAGRVEAAMRRFDPGGAIRPDATVRLSNAVLARLPLTPAARRPGWRAVLDGVGVALGAGHEWGARLAVSVTAAALLGLVVGSSMTAADTQDTSAAELLALNSYLPLDAR